MRTYDIVDEAGTVLRQVTVDDTIRPAMLHGEELRLTHVDGEPAIQGEPLRLTDEERAALPPLGDPGDAEMHYATGFTIGHGERPDDAHAGTQVEAAEGAVPIEHADG